MLAITEFPTTVQEGIAKYQALFANEPERRCIAVCQGIPCNGMMVNTAAGYWPTTYCGSVGQICLGGQASSHHPQSQTLKHFKDIT